MTEVRWNERSWAIELISEINMMLSTLTLNIKKAGGENSVSAGGKTLFPDLLLYSDRAGTNIIQGWELKLPDISTTDEELILNASKKAKMLNLNSFFLWNFNTGCLYVLRHNEYVLEKTWSSDTSHIRTREDVETYRHDWLEAIKKILLEINQFMIDGEISTTKVEFFITNNMLSIALIDNKNILAEFLKHEAHRNRVMNSWLNKWWQEVKMEYISDEQNVFQAYSKVLLLNWVNKIVFAHLIKKYHNPALLVNTIQDNITIEEGVEIFKKITNECDFYSIFSPIEYSDKLSTEVWRYLISLNKFLSNNNLQEISQESLQRILENTTQMVKREINGQYTTPLILADILTRITVDDWTQNCLEPCSGTGTIAKSLIKNKVKVLSLEEAHKTTWISDKFSFPLQISNISLVNYDSINIPCQIFQANAFELEIGMPIEIINPKNGEIIQLELEPIDAITSNLPFVAFEISDSDEKAFKVATLDKVKEESNINISKKSDIYVALIFSLWNVLNMGGRMGIITSNSWLATSWGKQFIEALLYYFNIDNVIISGKGRWFPNARVVTTMLILEKKEKSIPDEKNLITFGILKKSIDEMKEDDVNTIIDSINLKNSDNSDVIKINQYSLADIFKLNNLGISWNALFYDMPWVLNIQDKLSPISSMFNIIRGSKRGWDDMFFPNEVSCIESEYIIKGIKTAKNVTRLIVEPDSDVFCCPDSIDELREREAVGTLAWIDKFAGMTNSTGILLPIKLENDRNKTHEKYWYELNPIYAQAEFFTSVNPNERLFFAKTNGESFINQRVIGLSLRDENEDSMLMFALINSTISMFFIESIGFGRGEGVLDLSKKRFEKFMMLNPDILTEKDKEIIKEKFKPLLSRDILPTRDELEMEDRIAFDIAVLDAYGLTEYYDKIKNSLINMQYTRLSVSIN
ncbi:N-6 DNA methylase [uncultured Tissierella sp.]|uniref:N-6 DNA methylase n=1 Tax=uncultured Tissierella sp. TaxID=448160 RepID=UPI0028047EB6|nr:N-6 DNA methylase [uncultured Tissierella sp.]MDU5082834.1 N-6 DNA methylase [Bacillota bacterium]